MTSIRRLSILAVVTMLVAGCSAEQPTAAPSAALVGATTAPTSTTEPEATPSPAPVPSFDLETPAPTDTPPPNCADPASEYGFATVSNDRDLYLALEFVSITGVDGEIFEVPDRAPWSFVEFLVGGRTTRFQPSYEDYQPQDLVMSAFNARLVMDNGSRHDLDVELEPADAGANIAAARVPDIEGTGMLRLSLTWSDSCYTVSAKTATRVIVDQPSAIAGCAEGSNRAFDELAAAFDAPIQVGSASVDLLPWLFSGKVASLGVIDPLPPYVGFTRESPTITVSPGATVIVTNTNPAVELQAGPGNDVIAFHRAPLIRWLEDGWIHGDEPDAEIVFRGQVDANDDGTFSFTVPSEPGRYGVEVVFDYDSECSYGSAGFVVGVDVE